MSCCPCLSVCQCGRPPPASFFFFFSSSRDHRDLHSFPTRRSSDLNGLRPVCAIRSRSPWIQERAPCSRPSTAAISSRPTRSEEHTSELQSLRHLVCRLLLEKKKKQNIE